MLLQRFADYIRAGFQRRLENLALDRDVQHKIWTEFQCAIADAALALWSRAETPAPKGSRTVV